MQSVLSPDLLTSYWRNLLKPGDHPVTGHCYIVAEVIWHLYGRARGYVPHVMRVPKGTHWFLRFEDRIIDPSLEQYDSPLNYSEGWGIGFLTKNPSRRAREVIRRLKVKLRGGKMAAKTSGTKAWETRRKNAISQRQRKAAFKAWKTRRANS